MSKVRKNTNNRVRVCVHTERVLYYTNSYDAFPYYLRVYDYIVLMIPTFCFWKRSNFTRDDRVSGYGMRAVYTKDTRGRFPDVSDRFRRDEKRNFRKLKLSDLRVFLKSRSDGVF